MPLRVSELGLNIIQFISNIYVGVLSGLMSNLCMLEKDCNGNPISTFPPHQKLPNSSMIHFCFCFWCIDFFVHLKSFFFLLKRK